MQRVSPSTALIWLAALLLVPSLWGAGFPATPVSHPAGCHSHGPMPPSPAQPSHQCCAHGHQWAISATTFSPDRRAALSMGLESEVVLGAESTNAPAISLFVREPDSRSESSPLRI